MPFLLSSLAATAKSNILSNWPATWDISSANAQKMVTAIADAFADSFSTVLSSTVINGGLITGGAAPPGGPLVGGVLMIPPGTVVMPVLNISASFDAPTFSVTFKGPTQVGAYTVWFKTLVNTLSSSLGTTLTSWVPTWTLPTGIALGGSAAWIASTPPAPGPWAGGTITPFTFIGQGLNASPLLDTFSTTFDATAQATPVVVQTDSKNAVTIELSTTSSSPMIAAFTKGIIQTMDDTFKQLMVKDPTGAGASGVAAPGGVITTGTISGLVFDAS